MSSGVSNQTITSRISTDNARIAGTQKYCSTQPSVLVLGTAYTPAEIVAVYQNDINAQAAVTAAELALGEARTQAKAATTTRNAFDKAFVRAIEGAYGNSSATLGTFGIEITTPKPPTAAVKAAAVTLAQATRSLRHTMGKKQKLRIQTYEQIEWPTMALAATA
jgi:hypothetical protein